MVLVAASLACPLAYLVMQRWLEAFAYRVEMGVETFIFGAALAFLVALLTVGFQSAKIARLNPIHSLRYE